MTEYNDITRNQLWNQFRANWKKQHPPKLFMSDSEKSLLQAMENRINSNSYIVNPVEEEFLKSLECDQKPSVIIKKMWRKAIEVIVPKQYHDDFYWVIDHLNRFPYSRGINHRTVRSSWNGVHAKTVLNFMNTLARFEFFQCTPDEWIEDRMSKELLDYKEHIYEYDSRFQQIELLIACRIDRGDHKVINAIKNIFLSEDNMHKITRLLIRAIIMSEHHELHSLLGNFLVAARLEEGARQAVVENMDCGTKSSFLTLLDVIAEHDLIRYSSIKRGLGVWTGVLGMNTLERTSKKLLKDMKLCLTDRNICEQYLKTTDSMQILIALWAVGFDSVKNVMIKADEIIKRRNRVQLLTLSYYAQSLQYPAFCQGLSNAMLEAYPEDLEIAAAFDNIYMMGVGTELLKTLQSHKINSDKNQAGLLDLTCYFNHHFQAKQHYERMKKLLTLIEGKQHEFYPFIFPWNSAKISRSSLLVKMAAIAWGLQDHQKIDEVIASLDEIDINDRETVLRVLAMAPRTQSQRQAVLKALANRESGTRESALKIAKRMILTPEEYDSIESFLKYKDPKVRKGIIQLLLKKEMVSLRITIERLLNSTNLEMRLAAIDLLKEAKEKPELLEMANELISRLQQKDLTQQEIVFVKELTGEGRAHAVLNEIGYGLYHENNSIQRLDDIMSKQEMKAFFSMSAKEMDAILTKLDQLIEEHKNDEYRDWQGEKHLLGNGIVRISYSQNETLMDILPFKELWIQFYETEIKNVQTLMNLFYGACGLWSELNHLENPDLAQNALEQVFPKNLLSLNFSKYKYGGNLGLLSRQDNIIGYVLRGLMDHYHNAKLHAKVDEVIRLTAVRNVPLYFKRKKKDQIWYYSRMYSSLMEENHFMCLRSQWRKPLDDELFVRYFLLYEEVDEAVRTEKKKIGNNEREPQGNTLMVFDYLRAHQMKLIDESTFFEAVFEKIGLENSLSYLSSLSKKSLTIYEQRMLEEAGLDEKTRHTGKLLYQKLIQKVLDVELSRGEMETPFSNSIRKIGVIYGAVHLIEILKMLGNSPLSRNRWGTNTDRKSCLSHLLKVSKPAPEDTAETLKNLLKSVRISRQRLIDTAMYAPSWCELLEDVLEMPGLKLGCWYFMAHMNENFEPEKTAEIARYTPLNEEELIQGAFDITWFHEAYRLLGEENFMALYESAKYISDGAKHARARKYADAALGKVSIEKLEKEIQKNRNKDLLMSYGIIEVKEKEELVHRYRFIQQFFTESKQFGAQRRESEKKAVEMALRNLATAAGYRDVTRLTLAMETEMVKLFQPMFEKETVDEYTLQVQMGKDCKAEILLYKQNKIIKSVPAVLKKHPAYVERKEAVKMMKDQFSRAKKLFETSMEEKELFTLEELYNLCKNPVLVPVVKEIIWIHDASQQLGWLHEKGFMKSDGTVFELPSDTLVRAAHPYDLFVLQQWREFQKFYFEHPERKQVFRQVFRQLYLKLEEEMDMTHSLLFAGNQVQPKKTLAALKSRGWLADPEEGLQKVDYSRNVLVQLYVQADWFSPADIEAPVLEWVQFRDLKTYKPLCVSEIDPILYSETMRDVDLVVSVAHAGNVDPEASHSTMEMRKVIVDFNLELFGFNNVTLTDSHALIEGKLASYSVHLGSGVVHLQGGPWIPVIHVASAQRGRFFLPFIDDDPKTSEILSKIIMFATDHKIKDPEILRRIKSGR